MTGSEALARATRVLAAAQISDPGRDARRLLAHVLAVPAGRLTLFLPEPLAPDHIARFDELITQRAARVPVSHLIGRRLFYGRDFLVTPDVLDPRPETETLIEAALAAPFDRVLDLGTGSGCILLTLLAETDGTVGIGTDLSAEALTVAHWNANAFRLSARAGLAQGDWWMSLAPGNRFDLIVSNPPYIAPDEMPSLAPEVHQYEPHLALTDGVDGLQAYRQIAEGLPRHLAPGGRVLLEIGPTQAQAVSALLAQAGLTGIQVIRDLDARDRVVQARMI